MTSIHIEAIKQLCIDQVERNLPLPDEILNAPIKPIPTEWIYITDEEVTTTETPLVTSTVTATTEMSVYTQETYFRFLENGCLFDCYGNGECQMGNIN